MSAETVERRRSMAAILRRKREGKGPRRPMSKEKLATYARKLKAI
jgi:hypothetical protein